MAEKKGITVKVDEELHAQVKEYIESHGMTMAEFVSQALDNELHPKQQMGGKMMGNTRTLAFQVPEELFQQIKDYLHRNNMTQKEFVIGLIQNELERDQRMRESIAETHTESGADLDEDESPAEDTEELDEDESPTEDVDDLEEDESPTEDVDDLDEDDSPAEDAENPDEDESLAEDVDDPDEDESFSMSM